MVVVVYHKILCDLLESLFVCWKLQFALHWFLLVLDELYFGDCLSRKDMVSYIDFGLALAFAKVADVGLSSNFALLKAGVWDVIGLFSILQLKIVIYHLLFYRHSIFQYHCVFNSAKLFLDLYSMKTDWVFFVAIRKRYLSFPIFQHKSSSLYLLFFVEIL